MKIVVQRVRQASVTVNGDVVGQIGPGLCALLGIHKDDKPSDTEWYVNKLINLRIFEDDQGKMNRSVQETRGEVLVVSQFTLYGDCQAGRRPSFTEAARPEVAEPIYTKFTQEVKQALGEVELGIFGAEMAVHLVNDGPVTLILERN